MKNTTKKPSKQMEFFKQMLELNQKMNDEFSVHPRRLHYFIVTLDEKIRQIPTNSGVRLYENTLNEYKNLCSQVAEARVRSFIPYDWIEDHKNKEIRYSPEKVQTDYDFYHWFNISAETPELMGTKMRDWDRMLESIEIEYNLIESKFQHQDYYICVVIEKSTYVNAIHELCEKHGADFLVMTGQPSVTRAREVCFKAMQLDKPLLVLYVSDLDVAGWFMPDSFMKRVNQIYKGKEHEMIRVALLRDQAEDLNLPTSFETHEKKYKQSMMDRFLNETNSLDCIELDALSKRQMVNFLDRELEQYSGIQTEQDEMDRLKDDLHDYCEQLLEDLDISEIKQEYDIARSKFNRVLRVCSEFMDRMRPLINEVSEVKDEIEDRIKQVLDGIIESAEL